MNSINCLASAQSECDHPILRRLIETDSGCWEVEDCDSEYPEVRCDGRRVYVSRLVWRLLRGELTDDLQLRGFCGNKQCVSPWHRHVGGMAENFDSYVRKTATCWEWTGATNTCGYGTVWDSDKTVLAHRLAYERMFGPIRDGLELMHTCDNPSCCRPDHLKAVTHQQNMADMRRKGRARNGYTKHRLPALNAAPSMLMAAD